MTELGSVSNTARDLAVKQLSTNGRFSFEAGRYIAEAGFRAELSRITDELAKNNTFTLQKPNFVQDAFGNFQTGLTDSTEEVNINTVGGAFQLQTYTNELQSSSQAAKGVSQLALDKQNDILSNLAK